MPWKKTGKKNIHLGQTAKISLFLFIFLHFKFNCYHLLNCKHKKYVSFIFHLTWSGAFRVHIVPINCLWLFTCDYFSLALGDRDIMSNKMTINVFLEKIRETCPVVNHEWAGDDLQDDHSHRKHLARVCMPLGDIHCGVSKTHESQMWLDVTCRQVTPGEETKHLTQSCTFPVVILFVLMFLWLF